MSDNENDDRSTYFSIQAEINELQNIEEKCKCKF